MIFSSIFIPTKQAQAQDYDYLKNGDFSYPAASGYSGYICPNTGNIVEWDENINYRLRSIPGFNKATFGWDSNDWFDFAGDTIVQCGWTAEIVAEQQHKCIYQDVQTVANAKYVWYLEHCARMQDVDDTMTVNIGTVSYQMPQIVRRTKTSPNGKNTVAAYTEYQKTHDNTWISTHNWNPSDSNGAFTAVDSMAGYSGTWYSPGYAQTTRFTFYDLIPSIHPTWGNMVDNIGFTIFNPSVYLSYSTTNGKNGGTAKITSATNSVASGGLSASAGWNGSASISITPATGYHIQSITVDGVQRGISNTLSLTGCVEDHTVKVTFAPNEYTIRYNTVVANDFGAATTGSTASSSHVYDASKSLTANGFVREGFTFKGWGTADKPNTVVYTNKQSVKNLTTKNGDVIDLYAVWEPIYVTASYYYDGEVLPYTEKIQYGTKFTPSTQANALATRENCDGFYGWYVDSDYQNLWVNGTRLKTNTTFYGRNAVHLDFDATDRTYDQVDAGLLYTDETTTILVDNNVLDDAIPEPITGKWYGDTVSIASSIAAAPAFYSVAAEISHTNPCMGGWTTPRATGTRNETFTLVGNRIVYVDWAATGAYDGARSEWNNP